MAGTGRGGEQQGAEHARLEPSDPAGPEAQAPVAQPRGVLDDVDALLDEIDAVLEDNAEEFVRGYVQKGGQ